MSAVDTVKNKSKEIVDEAREAIEEVVEKSPAKNIKKDSIKEKAAEVKERVVEAKERVVEAAKAVVTRATTAKKPGLTKQLVTRVRRLLHLGLGAVALINDERKSLTERCIERGESVENDTREATTKLIKELKRIARREKEEHKAASA